MFSNRALNLATSVALRSSSRVAVKKSALSLTYKTFVSASPRLFSTSTVKLSSTKISDILKNEYELELKEAEPLPENLLSGSGFEILEGKGNSLTELQKKSNDEIIHVYFDCTDVANVRNEQADELEEQIDEDPSDPFLNLNVVVENTQSNTAVSFEVITRPELGQTFINSVTPFENAADALSESSEAEYKRGLKYPGPPFETLDESLQEAFDEYLNAKGVDDKLIEIIMSYGVHKENEEYLNWLQSMKKIFS